MAVVRQEKNIMTRHPMLILMFAFVLRASSFAAENPAAKHLAPFADDQTVAILDLDVDRLDVDALKQKAEELSAKLAPEEQRHVAVMLALGIPVLKNGKEAF